MGLRWISRTLLRKWYLLVSGVLMSTIAAAALFSTVPPAYSSSGVLVLVQPRQPGPNSTNPLLSFDASLSTTAALLVQQLDSPAARLAVRADPKSTYTVKNVGEVATHDLSIQPFIYFTTQSGSRDESMQMVARLADLAQQELRNRQDDLKVRRSIRIRLESVVDPTAAKYVVGSQVAASGGALVSGIAATVLLILGWERLVVERRRHRPEVSAARDVRPGRALVEPRRDPASGRVPTPVDPELVTTSNGANGVIYNGAGRDIISSRSDRP